MTSAVPLPSAGHNRETTSPASPASPPAHLSSDILHHAAKTSMFFKSLADPTRLSILYLIATHPDGRASSNALAQALGISAPTVTHHMKKLVSARLVAREQVGKWAYHSLHPDNADTVAKIFSAVTAG